MATMKDEMVTIFTDYIVANYGTLASTARTTMSNSIDTVIWRTKSTGDPIVDLIATVFIGLRGPGHPGWLLELSATQKKSLYDEVDAALKALKDSLDAMYTAVHAAYIALP